MRMYYENVQMQLPLKAGQHIEVPVGVAIFPKDPLFPPREVSGQNAVYASKDGPRCHVVAILQR